MDIYKYEYDAVLLALDMLDQWDKYTPTERMTVMDARDAMREVLKRYNRDLERRRVKKYAA